MTVEALAAVLGAGVPRWALALVAPFALVNADVVSDDAFYYLTLVRRLVEEGTLSFDGGQPTNGFHPLYFAWLLVGQPLFDHGPAGLLRWGLIGGATAGALGGLFAWRIGHHLAGRPGAASAALFYALTPALILHSVNGLETGFALLAALVLVERWLDEDQPAPGRGHLRFGALGGLAVLARVDLALLLAVLTAHRAVQAGQRGARPRFAPAARAGALTLAGFALVWGPWALLSLATTSYALPHSGEATRQLAELAYDLPDGPVSGGQAFTEGELFSRGVGVLLRDQPALSAFRLTAPLNAWPELAGFPLTAPLWPSGPQLPWPGVLLLAALLGLLLGALQTRRAAVGVLLGWVLLFVGAYALRVPAWWYFARYLAQPSAVLAVLAGAATGALYRRRPRLVAWTGALVIGLPALLTIGSFVTGSLLPAAAARSEVELPSGQALYAPRSFFGRMAHDVAAAERALPDAGARVGAFQAGLASWILDARGRHQVINLDGKVSPDAMRALAEGRTLAYLREREAGFVLEQPSVLETDWLRREPGARACLEPLRVVPHDGTSLYRVLPPGECPAAPVSPPRAPPARE